MMGLVFFLWFLIPLILMELCWVIILFSTLFIFLYFMVFVHNLVFFSSISYVFGFDSISYGLILLSFLVSSYMIISMVFMKKFFLFNNVNLFLLMMMLMIFGSMSFIYMYISFEFVLIPLLVLILGWGYQPERLVAGMYLFFYTLLFSLPLFLVIVFLYSSVGSLFFNYLSSDSAFFIIYFIMVLVFLVKLPMYLVHFWLPKAHVQAPVAGSMILAGIMLKIGGYGLIRMMFMFESMFIDYSYIWFSFSMVGSLLISIVCLVQGDMKCLIAYSSISHMGMVIMGIMTMGSWGVEGSYFLMLGHGFCSSGLFYMANLFYSRSSSRSFFINKGLIIYMPSSCIFWFLLCCFNMSCPPSLNFISELMILANSLSYWGLTMGFFMLISFFCACFSYYLYSYSQHGVYHNLYSFSCVNVVEFLCLFMHIFPLAISPLLITNLF